MKITKTQLKKIIKEEITESTRGNLSSVYHDAAIIATSRVIDAIEEFDYFEETISQHYDAVEIAVYDAVLELLKIYTGKS